MEVRDWGIHNSKQRLAYWVVVVHHCHQADQKPGHYCTTMPRYVRLILMSITYRYAAPGRLQCCYLGITPEPSPDST